MSDRTNGLVVLLITAILSSATTGFITTYWQSKKFAAALEQAAELKGKREVAVKEGENYDTQANALRDRADLRLRAAENDALVIAQRKARAAQLKGQPRTIPVDGGPTEIEKSLDDVIVVLDKKIANLEGAVQELQGALKAKTAACDSYKEALGYEIARSGKLETAIRNAPRDRPWSAGLLYGKDSVSGATKIGAFAGRSFGPIRGEVVVTQNFVAVGVGISW